MTNLKNLLKNCALSTSTGQSSRKLITFRSKKSYMLFLKHLESAGIKPFKTVTGSRMIGCHINKNSKWKELKKHPHITILESDRKVIAHGISRTHRKYSKPRLSTPATKAIVTWNIRRIKAPAAWPTTRGNPIKVAILDTGIAKHPDLRIVGGVNTINGGSYKDDHGHGTHVAGIAAALGSPGGVTGAAPRVRLYAVKVLNRTGGGTLSDIIEGINWCIQNRIQVINMSLGIIGKQTSRTLHAAIKRAHRKGIVIVASAGNYGNLFKKISQPASYKETIAVAATTRLSTVADFNSIGRRIAIAAPGKDILSTWLNGKYKIESGTSMAAPHVAGGAALLLAANPGMKPSCVKRSLRMNAKKLRGFTSLAQGAGLMQLNRITKK